MTASGQLRLSKIVNRISPLGRNLPFNTCPLIDRYLWSIAREQTDRFQPFFAIHGSQEQTFDLMLVGHSACLRAAAAYGSKAGSGKQLKPAFIR
jgi:hypothetical protein